MLTAVNTVLTITSHASPTALLWGNAVLIALAALLVLVLGAPRRYWR